MSKSTRDKVYFTPLTSYFWTISLCGLFQNTKINHMAAIDFTTHLLTNQSMEEVFNAVINVRGWWSESIEGQTQKLRMNLSTITRMSIDVQ